MGLELLVSRPIAFHASFARLTGSVQAGLMLSQAVYWTERTNDHDGWFYKTQDEWEEETCLGRREQETARKKLRSFDFWHEAQRGGTVRRTIYFRVDLRSLLDAINDLPDRRGGKGRVDMADSAISGSAQNSHVDMADSATSNTETTSETTPETTLQRDENPNGFLLKTDVSNADMAVQIWNEVCAKAGLAKVQKITASRRSKLQRRLKSDFHDSFPQWRKYCQRIASSSFLTGRSSQWKATFDWCLEPKNMAKVMEGNYEDGGSGPRDYSASTRSHAVERQRESIRVVQDLLNERT